MVRLKTYKWEYIEHLSQLNDSGKLKIRYNNDSEIHVWCLDEKSQKNLVRIRDVPFTRRFKIDVPYWKNSYRDRINEYLEKSKYRDNIVNWEYKNAREEKLYRSFLFLWYCCQWTRSCWQNRYHRQDLRPCCQKRK